MFVDWSTKTSLSFEIDRNEGQRWSPLVSGLMLEFFSCLGIHAVKLLHEIPRFFLRPHKSLSQH